MAVRADEQTGLACDWHGVVSIAIMIATPEGSRILAFSSERKAADAAETILRRFPVTALPAPVWIECTDPAVTRRLSDYLAQVQAELVGM